jgi:hypothetical protein
MIKRLYVLFLLLLSIGSCKKKDLPPAINLFDPSYKDLKVNSGFKNNNIPINGTAWSVEYVKDAATGKIFLDQAGQPVSLKVSGSVELQNGWLKLEKQEMKDQLTLSLQENLSANPRKFLIGILADGKRDQLSFTQSRGAGYAIVNKNITEIAGSRKENISNEGLHEITLTNNDYIGKNLDITEIFKDVKHMSEFTSANDDAFNWVNSKDTSIFMTDIIKDNQVYWSRNVIYKKGQTFDPYVTIGISKIDMLVRANTTVRVRAKMIYLSRESNYNFTIKNLSSGHTFEVSGIWKQKVPISTIVEVF